MEDNLIGLVFVQIIAQSGLQNKGNGIANFEVISIGAFGSNALIHSWNAVLEIDTNLTNDPNDVSGVGFAFIILSAVLILDQIVTGSQVV